MRSAALAHPDRFADRHRVESSAELAAKTAARAGCCSAPSLLVVTNAPCLLAGCLHGAMGRWVPAVIFCGLAIASCLFHYFGDVKLRPSLFWARTDKSFAYAGMAYHLWLFLSVRSFSAVFAGAVCISSVGLYNAAFTAWERGRVADYNRLHSLWHIAAGIGTIHFAMLA